MPTVDNENLTKRETATKNRIDSAFLTAEILKKYFENGFTSFEAMKSIVVLHCPEIDLKRLENFWHFRAFDEDIVESLKEVFEKIKP